MLSGEHPTTQAVRPEQIDGTDDDGNIGLGVSLMEIDEGYGVVIYLDGNDEEDDWDGNAEELFVSDSDDEGMGGNRRAGRTSHTRHSGHAGHSGHEKKKPGISHPLLTVSGP